MNNPSLNQVAVRKASIENMDIFIDLLMLYNLRIISDEQNYVIVDGSEEDLKSFKEYWSD